MAKIYRINHSKRTTTSDVLVIIYATLFMFFHPCLHYDSMSCIYFIVVLILLIVIKYFKIEG